jgi:hypothetical protein
MHGTKSRITLISAVAVLVVAAQSGWAQGDTRARVELESPAQTNVILEKPSWQAVLDKLFGTPERGLLDGKGAFQFRAEDLKLTSEQAASFFTPSSTSTRDFGSLIEAAAARHGQVRMEGTIDGRPFELKLAGRELKLEGIILTAAQREALIADLRNNSGLRQMKIEGLVDGKETRIIVAGGKERISVVRNERPENDRRDDKEKLDRPQKVEVEHRGNSDRRVEVDRGVRVDTRMEREDRRDRAIEKPEHPRSGK